MWNHPCNRSVSVGYKEGVIVSGTDGFIVGVIVGTLDGAIEGDIDGEMVGIVVDISDGIFVGTVDGISVGVFDANMLDNWMELYLEYNLEQLLVLNLLKLWE